jgi:hypothetical protein
VGKYTHKMIRLKPLLIEEEVPRILIPRNVEERKEKLKRIHWRKVLKYIKSGCRGDLDLYKTPLEFLPESLTYVGGCLNLSFSKIKKLPDKLEKIGRSLWLRRTPLEFLPDELTGIGGYLDLTFSRIKKLPDKLEKIEMGLYLSATPIDQLPVNLSIGENLSISQTPLSQKYTEDEIRKMVKHIGGDIYT